MRSRLESLRKAVVRLREALKAPGTDLSRDAAIHRFEFCFELAWKTIQGRALDEGLECQSPKGCLKLALKLRWLAEETSWLEMLEDRNQTSHTYDEEVAKRVYNRLAGYVPPATSLCWKTCS